MLLNTYKKPKQHFNSLRIHHTTNPDVQLPLEEWIKAINFSRQYTEHQINDIKTSGEFKIQAILKAQKNISN